MLFNLYWMREDRQGAYWMGAYPTKTSAEAAIPAAMATLLKEASETRQKQEVSDGAWSLQEAVSDHCTTCDGAGVIDERLGGTTRNGVVTCPDCNTANARTQELIAGEWLVKPYVIWQDK